LTISAERCATGGAIPDFDVLSIFLLHLPVFGSSSSTRANSRAVLGHASWRTLRDLAAAIISVAKIRFEHLPVFSGATSTGADAD